MIDIIIPLLMKKNSNRKEGVLGKIKVLPSKIKVSVRVWDDVGFGKVMKEYAVKYWRYWTGYYK